VPNFTGPYEARDALLNFIIDRTAPVPSDIRDRLRELLLQPSPAAGTAEAVELIYARRDEVPAELAVVAADAAAFCASVGFHGLGDGGRGTRIALVLRESANALADGVAPLPESEQPVPLALYVPAPAEEAPANV
jgi:hypothetical protein